jgi:hypothetical protein
MLEQWRHSSLYIDVVMCRHVRALEWFGVPASMRAVVSVFVRALEWFGTSA